jgi:hypothetical protein
MKLKYALVLASIILTLFVAAARAQHTYSKAVQKACANDYHSPRKPALTPLSMPERSAELRLSVESEPAGDALKYENAVGQKPWTVSIRNHHGL